MRILLIEDNLTTVHGLRFLLEHEGFKLELATDATMALERFSMHLYDLVLLDINLPGQDGFAVATEIKKFARDVPIIFITARDDEQSVVRGFDLGADDYVIKPFRNRELISRINATLRRRKLGNNIIACGDLTLDEAENTIRQADAETALSALEYKILRLLMLNAGSIVKRERLLDEIWDHAGNIVNDNTLTVYIKRIRAKIGQTRIQTIKNVGYKMERQ